MFSADFKRDGIFTFVPKDEKAQRIADVITRAKDLALKGEVHDGVYFAHLRRGISRDRNENYYYRIIYNPILGRSLPKEGLSIQGIYEYPDKAGKVRHVILKPLNLPTDEHVEPDFIVGSQRYPELKRLNFSAWKRLSEHLNFGYLISQGQYNFVRNQVLSGSK